MLHKSELPFKFRYLNIKNFVTDLFNKSIVVIILILLLSFSEKSIAQSNLGFEYFNLSFWNCYRNTSTPTNSGTVNTTTQDLYNGTTYYVPGNGVKTKYIRVTAQKQKNDPYGNYPVVCPYQGGESITKPV